MSLQDVREYETRMQEETNEKVREKTTQILDQKLNLNLLHLSHLTCR